MIAKDITEIAIGTKDIKVPFILKRNIVRPILMGLRDAIIKKGDVTILGFGRFYIYRKKVSKGIGSPEKKMILAIAFRPSKMFLKAVETVWTSKIKLDLDSGSPEPSKKEPVQSVPSKELQDIPADTATAEVSSTTSDGDW